MKRVVLIPLLALAFCKEASRPVAPKPAVKVMTAVQDNAAYQSEAFTLADFFTPSLKLDSVVEKRFAGMSVEARAAQMVFHATSEQRGALLPFEKTKTLFEKGMLGGVLFLKGDVNVFKRQLRLLDSIARKKNLAPPAFACDCEPTLYHKKFLGLDSVTSAAYLKNEAQVRQAATTIGHYIRRMGINVNFAPVADVAANKAIINTRSFGTKPSDIVGKSSAFVSATQGLNIVSAIKHFPGHGNVQGDTHKGQVTINGELTELETFKRIIAQSRPVMVMVGHMTVKNNAAYGTAGLPCTLSPTIMTKLLKEEMKYKGIVITDAMRMLAVKNIPDADWKAVQAGADVVLVPVNPAALHGKIVAGLKAGEMKEKLETSVRKVVRMKICLGLL